MKKLIIWTFIIFIIGTSIGLNIAQAQTIELQERTIDGHIMDLYQQQNAMNKELQDLKDQFDPARLNKEEVDILAKLIYTEARGESLVGQVAVGAVVLNRIKSGKFSYAKTIKDVVYAPGQFSGVTSSFEKIVPTEQNIEAAQKALLGIDPTDGAIFFYNPKHAKDKWIRTRPVVGVIGNHTFAV